MAHKVVYIEPVGEITISKNRRSRKLRMTVRPNKQVVVTIPFYSSFRDAETFARNNTEWIIKQQKKIDTVSEKYALGSKIQTKYNTITITEENGPLRAVKSGNRIEIFVTDVQEQPVRDFIREVMVRVYRIEALQYLPDRLNELARRFGFSYNRITVRNNRRNWGSCSSKNNISMNLQVMKLPDHLIDYILLHELAHTIEKNHGPRFWKLLDQVTGNRAKELSREVRRYSPHLP